MNISYILRNCLFILFYLFWNNGVAVGLVDNVLVVDSEIAGGMVDWTFEGNDWSLGVLPTAAHRVVLRATPTSNQIQFIKLASSTIIGALLVEERVHLQIESSSDLITVKWTSDVDASIIEGGGTLTLHHVELTILNTLYLKNAAKLHIRDKCVLSGGEIVSHGPETRVLVSEAQSLDLHNIIFKVVGGSFFNIDADKDVPLITIQFSGTAELHIDAYSALEVINGEDVCAVRTQPIVRFQSSFGVNNTVSNRLFVDGACILKTPPCTMHALRSYPEMSSVLFDTVGVVVRGYIVLPHLRSGVHFVRSQIKGTLLNLLMAEESAVVLNGGTQMSFVDARSAIRGCAVVAPGSAAADVPFTMPFMASTESDLFDYGNRSELLSFACMGEPAPTVLPAIVLRDSKAVSYVDTAATLHVVGLDPTSGAFEIDCRGLYALLPSLTLATIRIDGYVRIWLRGLVQQSVVEPFAVPTEILHLYSIYGYIPPSHMMELLLAIPSLQLRHEQSTLVIGDNTVVMGVTLVSERGASMTLGDDEFYHSKNGPNVLFMGVGGLYVNGGANGGALYVARRSEESSTPNSTFVVDLDVYTTIMLNNAHITTDVNGPSVEHGKMAWRNTLSEPGSNRVGQVVLLDSTVDLARFDMLFDGAALRSLDTVWMLDNACNVTVLTTGSSQRSGLSNDVEHELSGVIDAVGSHSTVLLSGSVHIYSLMLNSMNVLLKLQRVSLVYGVDALLRVQRLTFGDLTVNLSAQFSNSTLTVSAVHYEWLSRVRIMPWVTHGEYGGENDQFNVLFAKLTPIGDSVINGMSVNVRGGALEVEPSVVAQSDAFRAGENGHLRFYGGVLFRNDSFLIEPPSSARLHVHSTFTFVAADSPLPAEIAWPTTVRNFASVGSVLGKIRFTKDVVNYGWISGASFAGIVFGSASAQFVAAEFERCKLSLGQFDESWPTAIDEINTKFGLWSKETFENRVCCVYLEENAALENSVTLNADACVIVNSAMPMRLSNVVMGAAATLALHSNPDGAFHRIVDSTVFDRADLVLQPNVHVSLHNVSMTQLRVVRSCSECHVVLCKPWLECDNLNDGGEQVHISAPSTFGGDVAAPISVYGWTSDVTIASDWHIMQSVRVQGDSRLDFNATMVFHRHAYLSLDTGVRLMMRGEVRATERNQGVGFLVAPHIVVNDSRLTFEETHFEDVNIWVESGSFVRFLANCTLFRTTIFVKQGGSLLIATGVSVSEAESGQIIVTTGGTLALEAGATVLLPIVLETGATLTLRGRDRLEDVANWRIQSLQVPGATPLQLLPRILMHTQLDGAATEMPLLTIDEVSDSLLNAVLDIRLPSFTLLPLELSTTHIPLIRLGDSASPPSACNAPRVPDALVGVIDYRCAAGMLSVHVLDADALTGSAVIVGECAQAEREDPYTQFDLATCLNCVVDVSCRWVEFYTEADEVKPATYECLAPTEWSNTTVENRVQWCQKAVQPACLTRKRADCFKYRGLAPEMDVLSDESLSELIGDAQRCALCTSELFGCMTVEAASTLCGEIDVDYNPQPIEGATSSESGQIHTTTTTDVLLDDTTPTNGNGANTPKAISMESVTTGAKSGPSALLLVAAGALIFILMLLSVLVAVFMCRRRRMSRKRRSARDMNETVMRTRKTGSKRSSSIGHTKSRRVSMKLSSSMVASPYAAMPNVSQHSKRRSRGASRPSSNVRAIRVEGTLASSSMDTSHSLNNASASGGDGIYDNIIVRSGAGSTLSTTSGAANVYNLAPDLSEYNLAPDLEKETNYDLAPDLSEVGADEMLWGSRTRSPAAARVFAALTFLFIYNLFYLNMSSSDLKEPVHSLRTALDNVLKVDPAGDDAMAWNAILELNSEQLRAWTQSLTMLEDSLDEGLKSLVIVRDSVNRRAEQAFSMNATLNMLLGESMRSEDLLRRHTDDTEEEEEKPTLPLFPTTDAACPHENWQGIVKVSYGETRSFRVVASPLMDEAAATDYYGLHLPDEWVTLDNDVARTELHSFLDPHTLLLNLLDAKAQRGGENAHNVDENGQVRPAPWVEYTVEVRHPSSLLSGGAVLYDVTRLGARQRLLCEGYIQNANVVLWCASGRELSRDTLHSVYARRREARVVALFDDVQEDYTNVQLAQLCVEFPALFGKEEWKRANMFRIYLAMASIMPPNWLLNGGEEEVRAGAAASDSEAAASSKPTDRLLPSTSATSAGEASDKDALKRHNTVAHLCATVEREVRDSDGSEQLEVCALLCRRVADEARQFTLRSQVESWLERGADSSTESRERASRQLAVMRRQFDTLLEANVRYTLLAASSALQRHIDRYVRDDLNARHDRTTFFSTLCSDFKQHMAYFRGELGAIMGAHADALRTGLQDVLDGARAAGVEMIYEVPMDYICRPMDVDISALLRTLAHPADPSQWTGEDIIAMVPVVNLFYVSMRDMRGEFTQAVDSVRDQLSEELLARVRAAVDTQHAQAQRVLQRIATAHDIGTRMLSLRRGKRLADEVNNALVRLYESCAKAAESADVTVASIAEERRRREIAEREELQKRIDEANAAFHEKERAKEVVLEEEEEDEEVITGEQRQEEVDEEDKKEAKTSEEMEGGSEEKKEKEDDQKPLIDL